MLLSSRSTKLVLTILACYFNSCGSYTLLAIVWSKYPTFWGVVCQVHRKKKWYIFMYIRCASGADVFSENFIVLNLYAVYASF